MKVLFLDIDGVLNSAEFLKATSKRAFRRAKGKAKAYARTLDTQAGMRALGALMLDQEKIKLLNYVLSVTGAAVVISSAWRNLWPLEDISKMLEMRGFYGRIIGKTPTLDDEVRGVEIQAWLDVHPGIEKFAIVDDCDDMAHLGGRLVQTSFEKGLTKDAADDLIEMLT